jgi:hypothetical protein
MKHHQLQRSWLQRAACVIAVLSAIALVGASVARADDVVACPNSVNAPYSMQLRALTGPSGADLTVALAVDETSKCTLPDTLKKIQLKTFEADGTLASMRNITNVPAPGGLAKDIDLGQVPRDRRIDVAVLVQTGGLERTFVVHGTTTTLLRPDLVVREITPKQALAGKPFTLTAVIAERNGDVGASADVLLSTVPGSVQHIDVARGGSTTVSFPLTYGSPVPIELTLSIGGAAPAETDSTNNARTATVEITEHQLASPSRVLFPSLLGYGAQFNDHVYAPVTPWPAGTGYGGMEEKVKSLEPQLVRIFYNDNWDANADGRFPNWKTNYASFVKVVQLAQETGATINITFQNLTNVLTTPAGPPMVKFADVLEDLVRNHGLTNVRWADVGNEPNSGAVTFDQYNALYRALNAELVARGLRDQIQLMGGGAVENGGNPARDHYSWMQLVAANMGDILDGYAEHVYWFYYNPGRLEYRIRDTWHLMNEVLPPEQRKPTYLMEFGMRGNDTCGTKPAFRYLYYGADPSCPELWRTNIAGFQQLWFNVDSAQLGVAGTSKWDAYWGRYDNSSAGNQLYWMIGPPAEGSPVTPSYYAMSLLFHTTAPGWQIVGVDPWDASDWSVPAYRRNLDDRTNDQPEKELVAYAGPSGELTVIGLDTHGKSLNTASTDPPSVYSIGGLPPNTSFTLAEWNATGDGTNSIAETVTTNDAGVARFEVPLQAAFALTTVAVS